MPHTDSALFSSQDGINQNQLMFSMKQPPFSPPKPCKSPSKSSKSSLQFKRIPRSSSHILSLTFTVFAHKFLLSYIYYLTLDKTAHLVRGGRRPGCFLFSCNIQIMSKNEIRFHGLRVYFV